MPIHLTRDLDLLHRNLLSMCTLVEEMIHKAVDELVKPRLESSRELSIEDDEIDRWDVQIEEDCLEILALHQPVAIDLRRITTVMKIVSELERVADLGVNIAERASGVVPRPNECILEKLRAMVHLALDMLHRSIDAYVELDSEKARSVCRDDDTVDAWNKGLIEDLIVVMQEAPELIKSSMHLFSASRHVERVADHATNIAEDVVYLVEGEIIRHRSELTLRKNG
ncbi:phosphate signaling complex protein PhoU [Thalassoglobus sp.]|uniref:phosphate signaling complex protein PhoU n=1 Tax=Thalassoglobus sp. TaxID=2795869 RepID=UPI003AA87078